MSERRIEIVGGGLAGLSLGVALQRSGVAVTLHEAGDYPRHRVCGEFIAGLDGRTLDRLDLRAVLTDALRHSEMVWSIDDRRSRVQRLPSPALGLSRHTLDARLAERFVAAGGELRTRSRVLDHANRPGRVFAHGRRRATESEWLGLKAHVHGLPAPSALEMHLGDDCYVGLTAVEGGAVNVCGLFRRRPVRGQGADLLLAYLRAARLGAVADRLADAEIDAESFCAVAALGFNRSTFSRDGCFLGDACAMIPPFTGNGMAMAFQSAELALDPLAAFARGERDWAETCAVTNAALRQRFRLRLASADVLHPFLLRPRRQRWFAALGRARLLPFQSLYAALH